MKKIYWLFSFAIVLILFLLGCTKESDDPILLDSSVKVDSLYAYAGRDIEISFPRDFIFLDASETVQANPGVNDIQYEWRCLSYPQGTVQPGIIIKNEKFTEVDDLKVGKYVFELEIRFQHLKSFDFVNVTVNPDGLIGKTVYYRSANTVEINPITNNRDHMQKILSNDLVGRDKNKIQFEYWNDLLSEWKSVANFSLLKREGLILFENPWWDYPEFYPTGFIGSYGFQVRINYQ